MIIFLNLFLLKSHIRVQRDSLFDLSFDNYEKNFLFIVNREKIHTSRIIADILSPFLQQSHFIDKSITEFLINTKTIDEQMRNSKSNENDYFEDFLKLVTFDNIKIDLNRQQIYSEYFYLLGNTDEFFRIQPKYLEGLTEENAVDRLVTISRIPTEFQEINKFKETKTMDEIITFISSHFEKVDKEQMKNLDIDIIEEIIGNKSLKLHEEDSLLNFILTLYEEDRSYSRLFEYVLFNNLSMNALEKFIDLFEVEDFNFIIWKSICERLLSSKQESIEDNKRYEIEKYITKDLNYKDGKTFDGIMKYLTNETKGNIHDKGTIKITSNSIRKENEHPKNLVDYQIGSRYHSDNKGGAIICYDFKDKLVQVNAYTIKSNHNNNPHSYNLRNWVIEVSNDNVDWTEIDNHVNDSTLDGPDIVFTFLVKKKDNNFYRFVRLRQTGDIWSSPTNPNYFWFCFMEF